MARLPVPKKTTELLRAALLRATPQRVALVELLRTSSSPVSIEELHRRGKGKFDKATAYRILDALCHRGLARRIVLEQDHALFEIAGDHHHHAICTSCGRIEDVSACVSPALDERVRKTVRFARIDTHALEFFGLCTRCSP